MPLPSADEFGHQEAPLSQNLDPIFQEGSSSRKKSPKGKKKKRKDGSPAEENAAKTGKGGDATEGGSDKKVTQPPSSILAQLHKAQTLQSPAAEIAPSAAPPNAEATTTTSISHGLLEDFDAAPTLPPFAGNSIQDNTRDWASHIPYGRSPPDTRSNYGRSPPGVNGIGIAGSPPIGQGRQYAPESLQGGRSVRPSPPISPRAAFRQPARRSGDYHNLMDHVGNSPIQNHRRAPSIYSQHTQQNAYPLPHRPQAHFYAAPEIDFGAGKSRSMPNHAREETCCRFDTLFSPSRGPSVRSESVLLVGFEHGLDVFHVDKKRFDRIGRLAGLRGSVISAKILPPAFGYGDAHNGLPLIAVIVHGPQRPDDNAGETNAEVDEFDPSGSMVQALQTAEPFANLYETTVEIYSVRDGLHVQTLFRSPPVEVEAKPYGPPFKPPPVGNLSVQAKGRFVVISSGQSGEVYVFEGLKHENEDIRPFQCIGKTWTRTSGKTPSRSVSVSSTSELGAPGLSEGAAVERKQVPIAVSSLSPRWLAFVPPASSAQTTLHGTVVAQGPTSKIHGLSSHTSPQEPQVTCQLDTPEGESYLNKAVRDASQTFIKGARWVGGQGMQAWNNYWKPDSSPQSGSPTPLAPSQHPQAFPPTHAQDSKTKTVRSQTSLVSILDLEKLSKNQGQKAAVALQPLATFSLPNGCSLVSFTPDGLKLLTASAKGDVQQVWDLMRMVYGESGRFNDQNPVLRSPTVREVARFPRMTEARIIDVVWTEPRGARLAVLTGNGTAHVFDLPQKAFTWPPPRQVIRNAPAPSSEASERRDEEPPRPQTASSTSLGSAFSILSSTTSSTIAAVRGRRPSSVSATFPTTFGGFAGAGAQSGKAVAAGVNRSVSAAAVGAYDTLRHLGENRVTLPTSSTSEVISPGSVHWLASGALAITAGGLVRIYGISRGSSSITNSSGNNSNAMGKSSKRRPSVLAGKPAEFVIPRDSSTLRLDGHHQDDDKEEGGTIPRPPFSSAAAAAAAAAAVASYPSSFWRPTTATTTSISDPAPSDIHHHHHPLAHAEIDTSAASQPFHTDRRVNYYVYDDSVRDPSSLTPIMPSAGAVGGSKGTTWLFGQPIPATKVGGGNAQGQEQSRDDVDDDDDPADGDDNGGSPDDGGGRDDDNNKDQDEASRRRVDVEKEHVAGREEEQDGTTRTTTSTTAVARKKGKRERRLAQEKEKGKGQGQGEGEGEGEGDPNGEMEAEAEAEASSSETVEIFDVDHNDVEWV